MPFPTIQEKYTEFAYILKNHDDFVAFIFVFISLMTGIFRDEHYMLYAAIFQKVHLMV